MLIVSKQFRVYLLPSDIAALIDRVNSVAGVKVYNDIQTQEALTEVTSVSLELAIKPGAKFCLAQTRDARISSYFVATRGIWIIEDQSETIEFSTSRWNGTVLTEGRLYFQTDMLIGDSIWRKRREFLDWADRAFRAAKRTLYYSKELAAYIGKDAKVWHDSGGRFVTSIPVHPSSTPLTPRLQ